jgi:hypothetical protein
MKIYSFLPRSLALCKAGEMQIFPIGENTLSARNNTRVIRYVKLADEAERERDQRLCSLSLISEVNRIATVHMVAELDRRTNRYDLADVSDSLGGNRD